MNGSVVLVTGGAGFIGSNFVLMCRRRGVKVVNLDNLTYAGNPENLSELADDPDYIFIKGDIADGELVYSVLSEYNPDAVVNFAAESHVDRSIIEPGAFIQTNVVGTFRLLETTLDYWKRKRGQKDSGFTFLHVSTDEVFGSLASDDPAFEETTPYAPNSPYAASKAAGDHLVRSYYHTYGLPAIITNCSNNYGPRQFPEKLIPLMILNAVQGTALPIYGDGLNVRDWLYVDDHCEALLSVLEKGKPGETYNIGGECEKTNNEIVHAICRRMDEVFPESAHSPHDRLITYVKDRPGHDRRYAINCGKIKRELGWAPRETFESGMGKTIAWYLNNEKWISSIQTGEYRNWLDKNYLRR